MKTPDEWRLLEYLDGRLSDTERAEVERYLDEHPEARRLVREHRAVWDLLDDAYHDGDVDTSDTFRRETVERARVDVAVAGTWRDPGLWRRGVALAAAAALVVTLTVTWMSDSRSRYVVSDAERPVIGHLDLLRHLDFLEEHGDALDLVATWQRARVLDGEIALEGER